MFPLIDYTRAVRYELLHGREAAAAIARDRLGFLPVGCLERHGDHLPMGLDVLKAHGICCLAAQALGGVVFPPHFYSGIHRMTATELDRFTGAWGNLYTDASAEAHLLDILAQLARMGLRVLVLYSGHYPRCQCEMIARLADRARAELDLAVIPFCECFILRGDHAGVSETSLMLYLDGAQVNMTAIGPHNHADHGWTDATAPEQATAAAGEAQVRQIIDHLAREIGRCRAEQDHAGTDGL